MSVAKKIRNPFIQQYLIEIVFPLVGYFFFDWSIFIIGVYYLIDFLSAQILFYRRAIWVNNKAEQPRKLTWLGLNILVFLGVYLMLLFGMLNVIEVTQKSSQAELMDAFLIFAKEELWLLFPVVILMYHLKDQFTFYMPRRYLNHDPLKYIQVNILINLIIFILLLVGGYLWKLTSLENLIVILLFVIVKIMFDLTVKRYLERMS